MVQKNVTTVKVYLYFPWCFAILSCVLLFGNVKFTKCFKLTGSKASNWIILLCFMSSEMYNSCAVIICFKIHSPQFSVCVCTIFQFTVETLYIPRTVSYSSFDTWHRERRGKAFSWPIWECGLGRLWAAVMAGLAGLCNGPHLFTLGQRAPTADECLEIRWSALHHSHSSVLALDAFPQ